MEKSRKSHFVTNKLKKVIKFDLKKKKRKIKKLRREKEVKEKRIERSRRRRRSQQNTKITKTKSNFLIKKHNKLETFSHDSQ